MTQRRDFLKLLGASAVAGALWPESAFAADDALFSTHASIRRIGVQLYTVRDAMQKDGVDATLAHLARLGFREVEFAGYYNRTGAQIRAALRANGLASPSTHVQLSQLKGDELQKLLEVASTVGHKWLVLAFLMPNDRGSADKYNAHADLMLAAQDIAKKSGVTIAYHNHDFEFEPLGNTNGYEILLDRTKGSGIQFEMDLHWMSAARQDPVAFWTRFPGRFPLVHVKDNGGPPAFEIMPVGSGKINWAALFEKRNVAGIKHFYIEHDNPADPWVSLTSSIGYLKTLRIR